MPHNSAHTPSSSFSRQGFQLSAPSFTNLLYLSQTLSSKCSSPLLSLSIPAFPPAPPLPHNVSQTFPSLSLCPFPPSPQCQLIQMNFTREIIRVPHCALISHPGEAPQWLSWRVRNKILSRLPYLHFPSLIWDARAKKGAKVQSIHLILTN